MIRDGLEEAHPQPNALVVREYDEPMRALYALASRVREMEDGAEPDGGFAVEQSEALRARMEVGGQIVIAAKSPPFARRAPSDAESVLRAAGWRKFCIVSVSNAQSGASHSATSR